MSRREQRRGGDRGRLYPGRVYRGKVVDYDTSTNTYVVSVKGERLMACEDMVGVAGTFLGLQSHHRIPVGTEVLLNYGNPPWIVNVRSIEFPDPGSCFSRTMLGTSDPDILLETAGVEPGIPSSHYPSDLVEGEFEWYRANGMFIRFLLGLVSVGASDRAKLECVLHRELVRLVSRNYEHFSATGDHTIFDDGRLNQEEHGTCYEHERMGIKEGEPMMTEEMPEFDPLLTGRWRWSKYCGFLGDTVNEWFTDPQAAAGKMIDEVTQYRAGKFRHHVGHDGTFLLQSTGDIAIEHVHRIPVPLRLKHPEDPEGALRREMKTLDEKFLKQWEWKPGEMHHNAFKLRDYARYLSQFQSLARFHQMATKGEFKVPSEAETPQPLTVDPDREPAVWVDSYSTIRIMRDGSIVTMDSSGNVTSSGPYGILHSSASDYVVMAARDIVFKAGRSMFLSAKRHVELVAHRGSLLFKGRTAVRALCEKGVFWFKSDYDPESPYSPEEGDPEAEAHGELGMIFQTPNSRILLDSDKWLRIKAKERLEVDTGDIEVRAKGGNIRFSQPLLLAASELRLRVSRILAGAISMLSIHRLLKIEGGKVEVNRLHANSIRSNSPLVSTSKTVSEREFTDEEREEFLQTDEYNPEPPPPLPPVAPSQDWDALPAEEYVPKERLFEPLTQQRLRLGEALVGAEDSEYLVWDGMADALLRAPNTGTGTMWPGPNARWLSYEPQRPELGTPTDEKPESMEPVSRPLTPAKVEFRFLK